MFDRDSRSVVRSLIPVGLFAFRSNPVSKYMNIAHAMMEFWK